MTEEQDKHERLRQIKEEKIAKDIDTVKKQLSHERNLKLDAFNRVDDLQTQVLSFINLNIYLLVLNPTNEYLGKNEKEVRSNLVKSKSKGPYKNV